MRPWLAIRTEWGTTWVRPESVMRFEAVEWEDGVWTVSISCAGCTTDDRLVEFSGPSARQKAMDAAAALAVGLASDVSELDLDGFRPYSLFGDSTLPGVNRTSLEYRESDAQVRPTVRKMRTGAGSGKVNGRRSAS